MAKHYMIVIDDDENFAKMVVDFEFEGIYHGEQITDVIRGGIAPHIAADAVSVYEPVTQALDNSHVNSMTTQYEITQAHGRDDHVRCVLRIMVDSYVLPKDFKQLLEDIQEEYTPIKLVAWNFGFGFRFEMDGYAEAWVVGMYGTGCKSDQRVIIEELALRINKRGCV